MKRNYLLVTTALVAAMGSSVMRADDATPPALSPENKQQIERVVHDYLVKNPEVLIEASQVLQMKQQQQMQEQAKSAISQNTQELLQGSITAVGNAKGNVTLVEFFDYNCGHCKKMKFVIDDLMSKNNNLRVIYKEFPIFGKDSEVASKMAIAAGMQGQYPRVQEALFRDGGPLNEEKVMYIAKKSSLNMKKLKADMESKTVSDMLKENRELAEKLHLMGTPAFVVLSTPEGKFKPDSEIAFVPGAASEKSLQELINKAEAAGK